MIKYANSASKIEILGNGPEGVKLSSLDRLSAYDKFRTDSGFLYAKISAISSRVNYNNDSWPTDDLAGDPQIVRMHSRQSSTGLITVEANKNHTYGYSTFLHRPIFVEHNNSDPKRARGVIVDSKFHIEDPKVASLDPYWGSADVEPYHLPPSWIELLLEIDAESFPKFAKAVYDGAKDSNKGINGFSMGSNIKFSECSKCHKIAHTEEDFCNCVLLQKGGYYTTINPQTGRTSRRKIAEICREPNYFEISGVFSPADETALSREVIGEIINERSRKTSSRKKWSMKLDAALGDPATVDLPCPDCKGVGYINQRECPSCQGLGVANAEMNAIQRGDANIPPKLDPQQYPPLEDKFQDALRNRFDPQMHNENVRLNSREGAIKISDTPQVDMVKAPESVNTLRQEEICPVCSSKISDGGQCDVCGYSRPPDSLDDPDLTKAKQEVQQNLVPQEGPMQPGYEDPRQVDLNGPPQIHNDNTNIQTSSQHLISSMENLDWYIYHPKIGMGKINPVEIPVQPVQTPATNDPRRETVITNPQAPVTSRTAADMIATMKNADAASAAPEVASPDKSADVVGVGGFIEDSNEAASKADAQVEVTDIGSTSVTDVGADHDTISGGSPDKDDAGFNTDKTTDGSGPTKTWSGTKDQQDPVTRDPFPIPSEGVKAAAYDNDPFPPNDGGISDGSAVKGVEPSDPVGKADERVDVKDYATSPENNSGPTKTWSGTDGNGVLKQQDPVTPEPFTTFTSSVLAAIQLTDLEIEMGLSTQEDKYNRLAALSKTNPDLVVNTLETLQRVKTAGLRKPTSFQKGAGRLPSLRQSSSDREPEQVSSSMEDSLIFF